jgi:tryptophanyl-tRNA synthetase
LYRLFANEQQQSELADRYRAGGMGYGDAKQTLYDAAMEYFGPAFQRRAELEKNPGEVEDILQAGAAVARAKGREVLNRCRSACGLA